MKKDERTGKSKLRAKYERSDFPGGFVQGKYAKCLRGSSNRVLLKPEVAQAVEPKEKEPSSAGYGRVLIGTSGWMYKHWADGVFYPPRLRPNLWLPYYAERFGTVEINATFYRLPNEAAVAHWAAVAPKGFVYAVKCWRWATHMHKLQAAAVADAKTFCFRIGPMWRSLGPVLVQLPPSTKVDLERLEDFLRGLPKKVGRTRLRVALEVRHESWLTDATRSLLDAHRASLVLHDWRVPTTQTNERSPFVYIRRHGLPQYSGNYSQEQLQADAETIRGFVRDGRDVYVFFNNDARGYAVQNARRLMELTGTTV
jgi:uncharacterized protein YecE (DUF72 family)